MSTQPRSNFASQSVNSPGNGRNGTATGALPVVQQHQARRYATVVPTESFSFPFEPGEVLAGKYRVQDLIGVGGVGFVVAARHLALDTSVALKFLKPEFMKNPEAVRSFTLEARASFNIKSEHVARVHDVDRLGNGIPFMVMELLKGQDLRRVLQRHRSLSVELSADLILQSCEALAAAHALGIVHRDVKPENLFVTQSGTATAHVKMLDFGIARVSAATSAHAGATPSMVSVGTPPYMSPEQIRGSRELDARADQWSLGCVLYELLTGVCPFARMSIMQSCAAVLEKEPPPLREAGVQVPEELEQVIMRCLRKAPSERYRNVAELAHALSPFSTRYAYCSDRCHALLAEPTRRQAAPSSRVAAPSPAMEAPKPRVPTSTRLPVGRVPTATNVPANSAAKRRATLNPLSTPFPFEAPGSSLVRSTRPTQPTETRRSASPAGLGVPPASDTSRTQAQETHATGDVQYVLGIGPLRARVLLVAAGAAIGTAIALLLM